MRRIFPLVLLAIGLLHCAGANAEDAQPCEDGAGDAVSGKTQAIRNILAWWWNLEDGRQGTCKVTVVSLDKVPPECKAGAKLSASGKIIDVDIFDQMILDEVENLKCQ